MQMNLALHIFAHDIKINDDIFCNFTAPIKKVECIPTPFLQILFLESDLERSFGAFPVLYIKYAFGTDDRGFKPLPANILTLSEIIHYIQHCFCNL
jgi:hypothetical protein